jgi:hypothetical protein
VLKHEARNKVGDMRLTVKTLTALALAIMFASPALAQVKCSDMPIANRPCKTPEVKAAEEKLRRDCRVLDIVTRGSETCTGSAEECAKRERARQTCRDAGH